MTMFHYTAWPDHGVPKDPTLLFEIIHSLSQSNVNCTLVHCSAGVGRTGVFIALKKIIEVLLSNPCYLNLFETVLDLRKDRKFMVCIMYSEITIVQFILKTSFYLFIYFLQVMNILQYKFLYSAISTYVAMLDQVGISI